MIPVAVKSKMRRRFLSGLSVGIKYEQMVINKMLFKITSVVGIMIRKLVPGKKSNEWTKSVAGTSGCKMKRKLGNALPRLKGSIRIVDEIRSVVKMLFLKGREKNFSSKKLSIEDFKIMMSE